MYNIHSHPWLQLMKLLQKQSLNVILYGVKNVGKQTTFHKCLYDLYDLPIQKHNYEKDGFVYKREELYYEFNCEQTIYNIDDVWIRFIKDIFKTQKVWSSRKLIIFLTYFHKLSPLLQKKIMNYRNNTIQLIIHTESLHIQPILKNESYILSFRNPTREIKYIHNLINNNTITDITDTVKLSDEVVIYLMKHSLTFKKYIQIIKTLSYYLLCCHVSLYDIIYSILKHLSILSLSDKKIYDLVNQFSKIDIQKNKIHYDIITYEYIFLILYKYIYVNR